MNKYYGNLGEDIACNFLKNEGYEILDRNYRIINSEIDIIARDRDILVFVEVKTRNNENYGRAVEAVTDTKIKRIITGAKNYIYTKKFFDVSVRFDVMEVYLKSGKINHIKDAFSVLWGL